MSQCPQEMIHLAMRLADASADVIAKYYRHPLDVEAKSDFSPVTVADREAERAMRSILAKERPHDSIIGEEYGAETHDKEWLWVLDPIDGTRAFTCGKPMFGTLIALLHGDQPVLGIINQPVLKERWVGAKGYGTQLNGRPCKTRACQHLEHAIVNLGPQAFPFGNAVSLDPYRRLEKAAKTTGMSSDCYSYALLASGFVDLVIEHNLKLHDYAALIPVIEEAGGTISDWQGRRLTTASDGHVMACANHVLRDKAIDLLDGAL